MTTNALVRVPGWFCGTIRTRRSGRFANGDILAVKQIKPSDLNQIWRAKAVVVQSTTIPPHVGVICRICGIPIVVCDNLDSYADKRVHVSGLSGEIRFAQDEAPPQVLSAKWKAEYSSRYWQVSICHGRQVSALSCIEIPLRFFLRHEFLWVNSQLNPFNFIEREGAEAMEARLYEMLVPFVESMSPQHDLHFRSLDARADEFELMRPSRDHHLGEHGLMLTLQFPSLLNAEFNVCRRIAKDYRRSVTYSFPFVGTVDQLSRALEIIGRHNDEVHIGVFVETPNFAEAVVFDSTIDMDLFIGTKDLASLSFGYPRGVGKSDSINPLTQRSFKDLIWSLARRGADANRRVYYFCFLEHLEESLELLPPSLGMSICAYEFSILSGIKLPSLCGERPA